ncbi:hypothetical protein Salat_0861500 [Sesamum alatum]|uniref:Uncharacterized protein n=1 Tax=Sesamum alatum TaxID=300844 RepID=A0AAE1YIQ1_9LAMI|nr:hypothetical protein Salat_0861500 [Sesamum alatum]
MASTTPAKTKTTTLKFNSEEDVAVALAKYTADLSEKYIKRKGSFSIVLSSGWKNFPARPQPRAPPPESSSDALSTHAARCLIGRRMRDHLSPELDVFAHRSPSPSLVNSSVILTTHLLRPPPVFSSHQGAHSYPCGSYFCYHFHRIAEKIAASVQPSFCRCTNDPASETTAVQFFALCRVDRYPPWPFSFGFRGASITSRQIGNLFD